MSEYDATKRAEIVSVTATPEGLRIDIETMAGEKSFVLVTYDEVTTLRRRLRVAREQMTNLLAQCRPGGRI